jgi:predicted transcriptional regulator
MSAINMKRERSRNKIFVALRNKPKRFTDLEVDTGLSAVGLTSILKILQKEGEIKLELIDDKKKYKLTKKGTVSVSNLNLLSMNLEKIMSDEGKYYSTFSGLTPSMSSCGLAWGIDSDLTLDKNIDSLNLLSKKDVGDIEEFIFKILSKNIPKNKLDEKISGEMILGFVINYSELIKSIKNKSLDYINNITKEELKLLGKYENDHQSLTDKEFKKMNDLRIKTLKKLKI